MVVAALYLIAAKVSVEAVEIGDLKVEFVNTAKLFGAKDARLRTTSRRAGLERVAQRIPPSEFSSRKSHADVDRDAPIDRKGQ